MILIYSHTVFKTCAAIPLGHVDGSMNKADKANLMHKLEERVESKPKEIDACAIDAMIFIRTMVNLTATFGKIAKLFLTNLTASTKRIYFVCDLYTSPSIKMLRDLVNLIESTCYMAQVCPKTLMLH